MSSGRGASVVVWRWRVQRVCGSKRGYRVAGSWSVKVAGGPLRLPRAASLSLTRHPRSLTLYSRSASGCPACPGVLGEAAAPVC